MAATSILGRTMKVASITAPGAEFEIEERKVPEPGSVQVRVKVQACGICHSDALTKDGHVPGIGYPCVPGHKVVGIIDAMGGEVYGWRIGQRVGVGWYGGRDATCTSCRLGDFRNCRNLKVPGISYDGGYQEYIAAPAEALVAVPDSLNTIEAAPLTGDLAKARASTAECSGAISPTCKIAMTSAPWRGFAK
jgi:D-arabinose 1-dehydrogenase-like Zn-dependent alcohol dehydrogenase